MAKPKPVNKKRRKAFLKETGGWSRFLMRQKHWKVEGLDAKQVQAKLNEEFPVPGNYRMPDEESAGHPSQSTPSYLRDAEHNVAAEDKPPVPPATAQGFAGSNGGGQRENVQWVAEHLELDGVQPKDCPNGTAWGLLQWARNNAESKADFWKTVFPRLMPTRTQLERDEERADGGRNVIRTIDELLSIRDAVHSLGAEGPARELEVSP